MKNNQAHFRGCLIGGAIGDALGYPVEFMSMERIKQKYGQDGIKDLSYAQPSGRAVISDDTHMTLFTAEGMLWADARGRERGICSYADCLFYSYQRWLYTQTGKLGDESYHWILKDENLDCKTELLAMRELFVQRAPGNTCLSSLAASKNQQYGNLANKVNNSKGCGGVMRAAPVGLYFYRSPESAFQIGAESAAITHGHPSGYLSAGALAYIIAEIIRGLSIREAALGALKNLNNYEKQEECSEALYRAIILADENISPSKAIQELGAGWVGEEALAIALYCVLKSPDDFSKAVCLAVNHSGDSDSTGSLCGNIVGAYLGLEGIPEKWPERIELAEIILKISDQLLAAVE